MNADGMDDSENPSCLADTYADSYSARSILCTKGWLTRDTLLFQARSQVTCIQRHTGAPDEKSTVSQTTGVCVARLAKRLAK